MLFRSLFKEIRDSFGITILHVICFTLLRLVLGLLLFYLFKLKKKKPGTGGSIRQTRKFAGLKWVDPIKTQTQLAQTHYLFFRVVFVSFSRVV